MKLIRRMLLCMLLAAVAYACVGCSVYREPVALLYGIEYGMTPAEVEAVLGEPNEVAQVTGMNDVTYTPATNGSYEDADGITGSYDFSVTLSRGTVADNGESENDPDATTDYIRTGTTDTYSITIQPNSYTPGFATEGASAKVTAVAVSKSRPSAWTPKRPETRLAT